MLLELRGCSSWGASAAAFRLISSSSSRCLLLLPFLVMGEQGLYPRCTFMPLFACTGTDGSTLWAMAMGHVCTLSTLVSARLTLSLAVEL